MDVSSFESVFTREVPIDSLVDTSTSSARSSAKLKKTGSMRLMNFFGIGKI